MKAPLRISLMKGKDGKPNKIADLLIDFTTIEQGTIDADVYSAATNVLIAYHQKRHEDAIKFCKTLESQIMKNVKTADVIPKK